MVFLLLKYIFVVFFSFFFVGDSLSIAGTLTGAITRGQGEHMNNSNKDVVSGSSKYPISRLEALLRNIVYFHTQDFQCLMTADKRHGQLKEYVRMCCGQLY